MWARRSLKNSDLFIIVFLPVNVVVVVADVH